MTGSPKSITAELRRNVFDWDDLRMFYVAAKTGSMNAAAAAMGCQQSTVSKRIKYLEERLNATLIRRSADGVSLTPAGEIAFEFVRTMHHSAEQMESRIAGLDRKAKGEVTLNFSDGLSTYWLSRSVARFLRENPEIELNLISMPETLHGPQQLSDLSITYVEEKDIDTAAEPLRMLHYMPFVSKDFINSYGEPKSVFDVLAHRFLKLENYRRDRNLWSNKMNALEAYLNYSFSTNISSVLFESLRHGAGVTMAPTYLAHLYPDDLVLLDCGVRQTVRFWLKYPADSARIARVQRTAEWVKSCFRPKDHPWFRDEFIHPRDFSNIEVLAIDESRSVAG